MQSPPFLVKNAYLRLIDVFCDSFEKIILKKGSYCQVNGEYSGTSMLLHLYCFYWAPWSESFHLFSSSVWETVHLPKHLGDWSKCCNERYFQRWIFWTWSMKLRTWCICLPLSLLLLRLLCGLSLMVGRLQLTGNSTSPDSSLLDEKFMWRVSTGWHTSGETECYHVFMLSTWVSGDGTLLFLVCKGWCHQKAFKKGEVTLIKCWIN